MEQLAKHRRIGVIQAKIEMWKNTVYDSSLDVKVGALVGNKGLETNAQNRVKEALQAIDFLEGELAMVDQEPDETEDVSDEP